MLLELIKYVDFNFYVYNTHMMIQINTVIVLFQDYHIATWNACSVICA